MMRYRATLVYDGTNYSGFQRQAAGISTVQATVEDAIRAVTGEQITIIGAGRTDTGVHARGQVIAFEVVWKHSADALLNAINAVLPDDIALQEIAAVGETALGKRGFHPRFDALSRLYSYTIYTAPQRDPLLRWRAWHVRAELNEMAMIQAAALLVGERDFAALGKAPQGENTVRAVHRSAWERAPHDERLLVYRVEANAFLQHMVRRIVGLLVAVGRGKYGVVEIAALLESKKLIRTVALAPPYGLVLEQVKYPGDRQPQVAYVRD